MTEILESGMLKGVASTTVKKLLKAGFTTVQAVAVTPAREIADLAGMGSDTAVKVCRLARMHIDPGFVPAIEVLEMRKHMIKCTTGSEELDRILGGGIETGAITELIGEFGSGKTQICFTLAVTAQQLITEGGFEGNVCVIDTEGTFMPERIMQVAEERGLDATKTLEGILIARAYNSEHQIILINSLPELVEKSGIKLVIMDSMIGHFRGEYIGRGTLAERQQKLGSCLSKLLRVAEAFNVSVVLTNQVMSTPDTMYGDPNKPTGGHVMAHACTHRVFLRKGRKNTRLARVIDSPSLPEEKIRFAITAAGVVDSDDD
ncbi:MAG: DNA repair and recombination protein RadA [Candidatus Bathyarchaeota archaeon]|nr:DNA repair and recombination protein RadA [Candidatus Bathyarchaeota archaeon]MDP6458420.1 DNA repair and recombination protein RadA [Candidatus Bathyarchaeota archaeon]MDP7207127.1 DNA repair and recombination protein RadA [Candidatus Bathyarchaeota archaeon]MDP7443213.1 DNA repair and recombination protein RadA [Candidatus Bathyarchaeota archaeon]